MKRWIHLALFALVFFLIALTISVSWMGSTAVHDLTTSLPLSARPLPEPGEPVAGLENFTYQEIELITNDGLRLHAAYVPSTNGAVVIMVHGLRSSYRELLPVGQLLSDHGYGVLMLDLRGHGLSEGEELTYGKKEVNDLEAAYQYLIAQPGINPQRIGLYGNSMGAGVSLVYAAQHEAIKAVVAHSPYLSLKDEIDFTVRKMPWITRFILRVSIKVFLESRLQTELESLSPEDIIARIAPRAVFLLAGGKDDMVDASKTQALFDAAGQPKEFWYDANVEHIGFYDAHPDEFSRRLLAFFDRYLQ